MTENDIAWMYELCIRKYSNHYDPVSSEAWFRNRVLKEPLLFWAQRTDNAFAIAFISTTPWIPKEFECSVIMLVADDGHYWEAIRLLRGSIDYARSRKCTYWRLTSDTDTDLAMFARRVGATEISPRFTIRL